MSKFLIVATSLFCIIGATVAYAGCRNTTCTTVGNQTFCTCF